MIDKKGENDFEFIYAYIEFMFYKMGSMILKVYTKRGRRFLRKELLIYACFSHLVYAYIFV